MQSVLLLWISLELAVGNTNVRKINILLDIAALNSNKDCVEFWCLWKAAIDTSVGLNATVLCPQNSWVPLCSGAFFQKLFLFWGRLGEVLPLAKSEIAVGLRSSYHPHSNKALYWRAWNVYDLSLLRTTVFQECSISVQNKLCTDFL